MNPHILHWSYRDFREFPNELLEHSSDTLEEIYLKENFISSIPKWLFQFVNLKFIQLSGNLLQTIPREICDLHNLEHLDVSRNQIDELPIQIGQLNKLQYLNVSENGITALFKGRLLLHWFKAKQQMNLNWTINWKFCLIRFHAYRYRCDEVVGNIKFIKESLNGITDRVVSVYITDRAHSKW